MLEVYQDTEKNRNEENESAKKKLGLKGTCTKCSTEISLYTEFSNGKLNRNLFKYCQRFPPIWKCRLQPRHC